MKRTTTKLLCLAMLSAASFALSSASEQEPERPRIKVYTNADLPKRPRVSVIGPADGSDPYAGMRFPAETQPEKIIVLRQAPGYGDDSRWIEQEDRPEPRSGNRATRGRTYRLPGYYPYYGYYGYGVGYRSPYNRYSPAEPSHRKNGPHHGDKANHHTSHVTPNSAHHGSHSRAHGR